MKDHGEKDRIVITVLKLLDSINAPRRHKHTLPTLPSLRFSPSILPAARFARPPTTACSPLAPPQALGCLSYLLSLGVSVFAFDFAGSGMSDGEYVSLGWYEREVRELRERARGEA